MVFVTLLKPMFDNQLQKAPTNDIGVQHFVC